jgi:Na+/melibiose symporter-like transporter
MAKKQYPEDFKTMFGVSTMGFGQVALGIISGMLMLYITDYAGLYTGIAGKAAQVATLMVLIGRIWDGINDPLLGFVMDRSPRTKWGRYKPFMFWGTLASCILIILLFNVPAGLSDPLKVVWLYVLNFFFDSTFTLMPMYPLVQTLSNDAKVRSGLLTALRLATMVVSMFMSSLMVVSIKFGPDGVTPNLGLGIVVFMVPLTIISLIGIAMIKEGSFSADEEKVEVHDLLRTVKANKPLWISQLSTFFGGFLFTLISTAAIYYIKYAFGVENFGTNNMVIGLIMMLTIIIGTILSQYMLKWMTPGIAAIISYGVSVVALLILWAINFAGPITSTAIFYPLLSLAFLGIGLGYVPMNVVYMETMDYNRYKIGKSMQGTINSINAFTMKLQGAAGTVMLGSILIAVGYDADKFKDATSIPASLFQGLGLVIFGLPAIFGILAAVVLYFYPMLRKSQREQVYAEIERVKHEHEMQAAVGGTSKVIPQASPVE